MEEPDQWAPAADVPAIAVPVVEDPAVMSAVALRRSTREKRRPVRLEDYE